MKKEIIKGIIKLIPGYLILPLFAILLFINIVTSTTDIKVWRGVENHLDELVYDHSSDFGNGRSCHTFKLYDKDSTVVCKVFLSNFPGKGTCVFDNEDDIVASSFNYYMSKKMYKTLIQRVPAEYITDNMTSRKNVLNKISQME